MSGDVSKRFDIVATLIEIFAKAIIQYQKWTKKYLGLKKAYCNQIQFKLFLIIDIARKIAAIKTFRLAIYIAYKS